MSRCGTADSHCCWLGRAGECRFVAPSGVQGFNWKCLLREKYGSWKLAEASPEYKKFVQPFWNEYPIAGLSCGKWPARGIGCRDCGEAGK